MKNNILHPFAKFMSETISSGYRKLSYALVGLTFFLMLMGSYVKAIEAGLSCPDWPLCYGQLFPFIKLPAAATQQGFTALQVFAEWFHRLIAMIDGLVMLWLAKMTIKYKTAYPTLMRLMYVNFVLYVTQVLFGFLTVESRLEPFIVVAHLGNAMLILMVQLNISFLAAYIDRK